MTRAPAGGRARNDQQPSRPAGGSRRCVVWPLVIPQVTKANMRFPTSQEKSLQRADFSRSFGDKGVLCYRESVSKEAARKGSAKSRSDKLFSALPRWRYAGPSLVVAG